MVHVAVDAVGTSHTRQRGVPDEHAEPTRHLEAPCHGLSLADHVDDETHLSTESLILQDAHRAGTRAAAQRGGATWGDKDMPQHVGVHGRRVHLPEAASSGRVRGDELGEALLAEEFERVEHMHHTTLPQHLRRLPRASRTAAGGR